MPDSQLNLRLPNRIVIVGGGLDAWLAAAFLGQAFRPLNRRITVVAPESPPTPRPATIASRPSLVGFALNSGSEEFDMMRRCKATFRLATQLSDWVQRDRDLWVPLDARGIRIGQLSLFESWFTERKAGRLLRPFHSYSAAWSASLAGKSPHSFSGESPLARPGCYGLHVETAALIAWLRDVALKIGAEEVCGDIERVFNNGRGGVAQVKLASGAAVPGDFFLDCSGTAARLLTTNDTSREVDWTDSLLCDRTISCQGGASRQVSPFTRVTALDSGWMHEVPIDGAIEYRLAYSSAMTADATAAKELLNALPASVDWTEQASGNAEVVSPGRRSDFWKDNVLAVGESACSLMAPADLQLHFTLAQLEVFLELMPDRSGGRASRTEYNRCMSNLADELAEYCAVQLRLTKRDDTEFWRAAQNVEAAEDRLARYDENGSLGSLHPQAIPAEEWYALLAGSGRLPQHPSLVTRVADPARTQKSLRELLKQNEAILKDLPLHEELLDWIRVNPSGRNAA